MEQREDLIERFQCVGCVAGSDTKCGNFKAPPADHDYSACESHVLGTFGIPIGSFALGLPKGFCRAGFPAYPRGSEHNNRMVIRLWSEGTKPVWDQWNVPVWAWLDEEGFLYVRTYSPRVNQPYVDVIEKGSYDLCPQAIRVDPEEMD